MAKVLREATLYRETGKTNAAGARILIRGKTSKGPDTGLRHKEIDILAGHFWVANLPDLTRWNEAYLEVTVVATKGKIKVPHVFKLEVRVSDRSLCANVQGAEMLTAVSVVGSGIEFRCTLTELDKIDQEKFGRIKGFVDDNDISGISQALLAASGATLPFNAKEAIKVFFNTVELIDGLNDDERIWLERPKLDLRSGTNNPLYEGWYALVTTPKKGRTSLPVKLYESGGFLYKTFKSEEDNEQFKTETYLTWQILSS